jgi:hypothetical protein
MSATRRATDTCESDDDLLKNIHNLKIVLLMEIRIIIRRINWMVARRGKVRTMCGSRTGGWSLPCVMSDWQRCVD